MSQPARAAAGLDRVLRGAQHPDPAGAVLDHGQDVDRRAVEQVGGEDTTTEDSRRIAELEREVRELRRANEILKAASAYFARELDPRLPR